MSARSACPRPLRRLAPLLAALALAGLSACGTVGPDYRLPPAAKSRQTEAQAPFLSAASAPAAVSLAPLPPHWWRLYRDEQLDALVEQALQANTDLRVAQAHLQYARAVREEVDAERGPHASASLAVQRAQESGEAYLLPEKLPVTDEGDAGLRVAYQLDLFGQLARAEELARAQQQASEAALDLVRTHVAAQTVAAFVQGCAATLEQRDGQQALDLQLRRVEVARRLDAAGRLSALELGHAEAEAEALRARLPAFEARRAEAHFRLAALLGLTPRELPAERSRCNALPGLDSPLPVGDGAALLRRRPDVREAERGLAAATARIGVAMGELYPHVTLGASAGVTGVLSDLGQSSTVRWGLGPLISWHIPDSAARARVRGAQADAQAALARFDGTVLTALRETETALSRYGHDLDALADLKAARERAGWLAQQNQRLHEAGRAPLLSQLDAQRGLLSARSALTVAQAQVAQDEVQLFWALGGGWE